MGIQSQQDVQKLETETYFNNLKIYAFERRGKFLNMLSSSQKRLLCFVWIHSNVIIFHLDIAFSRRLERQHCSQWDTEEMETGGHCVLQALSHGLSHSLAVPPACQIGCETSNGATHLKVERFGNSWYRQGIIIWQKQFWGSGQYKRAELQVMPTCSTTFQ